MAFESFAEDLTINLKALIKITITESMIPEYVTPEDIQNVEKNFERALVDYIGYHIDRNKIM